MDLKKLLCGALVASISLAGCKSDDTDTTSDAGNTDMSTSTGTTYCTGGATPTGGMTKTYVISALAAGVLNSGTNQIAGFNLDNSNKGVCDMANDPSGPAPDNFSGVDNKFGSDILPILASALAGQNPGPGLATLFQTNINDGTILILLQVSGIDSFENDSCVSINGYLGLVPGGAMPGLTSGTLTPGQTFDVDPRSLPGGMPLIRFASAGITNGRLEVSPSDFPLSIPIGGVSLDVTVRNTHLRFNIAETGISQGVLGGALRLTDIVSAFAALEQENRNRAAMDMMTINIPGGITSSTIMSVLGGSTDLEPDSMNKCQAISVGLTLSGTTATIGAGLPSGS